MKVKAVIDALLEIREEYPSLTNAEVLRVMELKILLEIKARLSR
jgi:hypothetical protein